MKICISNPPYNLKWQEPPFAIMQKRFCDYGVPPQNNANFAFVLSGIENCEKAAFILPNSVMGGSNEKEIGIIKKLVEKNHIEAVIACPDKMFEATSISVCILVINKVKNSTYIEFIDARETYKTEIREQRGQFGGKAHTGRVYKKEIKVFDNEIIKKISNAVKNKDCEERFCRKVSIEEVRQNNYSLKPSNYIEFKTEGSVHRSYKDIVNDLNRITEEKNCCKLTINKTLAKSIGLNDDFSEETDLSQVNELLKKLGAAEIIKDDYIRFTKNKVEFKFENVSKNTVSSVLIMILNMWKQHIYYLNNEQNRYLLELRDALLPELMTGKIEF